MEEVSERVAICLELETKLLAWRRDHSDDTPEEDLLLEKMDQVWWDMIDQERELIESKRRE
jgi:hypothetical protein